MLQGAVCVHPSQHRTTSCISLTYSNNNSLAPSFIFWNPSAFIPCKNFNFQSFRLYPSQSLAFILRNLSAFIFHSPSAFVLHPCPLSITVLQPSSFVHHTSAFVSQHSSFIILHLSAFILCPLSFAFLPLQPLVPSSSCPSQSVFCSLSSWHQYQHQLPTLYDRMEHPQRW